MPRLSAACRTGIKKAIEPPEIHFQVAYDQVAQQQDDGGCWYRDAGLKSQVRWCSKTYGYLKHLQHTMSQSGFYVNQHKSKTNLSLRLTALGIAVFAPRREQVSGSLLTSKS